MDKSIDTLIKEKKKEIDNNTMNIEIAHLKKQIKENILEVLDAQKTEIESLRSIIKNIKDVNSHSSLVEYEKELNTHINKLKRPLNTSILIRSSLYGEWSPEIQFSWREYWKENNLFAVTETWDGQMFVKIIDTILYRSKWIEFVGTDFKSF